MSCEQNVAKTLIKDTEGHFENRNHENNPEREARKKASFLGLSGKKARVGEATSGVFSDSLWKA